MAGMSTYSFKDVTAALTHPLAGSYVLHGQQGAGQLIVRNTTERTVHNNAADGAIMVSYTPGDNGVFEVEAQQTSPLHAFLLNWYNQCKTYADLGDVSNWATGTVVIRTILDGGQHTFLGVSFAKVPDKTYGAQGGMVTWTLMAAQVVHG